MKTTNQILKKMLENPLVLGEYSRTVQCSELLEAIIKHRDQEVAARAVSEHGNHRLFTQPIFDFLLKNNQMPSVTLLPDHLKTRPNLLKFVGVFPEGVRKFGFKKIPEDAIHLILDKSFANYVYVPEKDTDWSLYGQYCKNIDDLESMRGRRLLKLVKAWADNGYPSNWMPFFPTPKDAATCIQRVRSRHISPSKIRTTEESNNRRAVMALMYGVYLGKFDLKEIAGELNEQEFQWLEFSHSQSELMKKVKVPGGRLAAWAREALEL